MAKCVMLVMCVILHRRRWRWLKALDRLLAPRTWGSASATLSPTRCEPSGDPGATGSTTRWSNSMVKTGWFPTGMADEDRARQMFVAVTGLQAFRPNDEVEAMLCAQAMASHHAAMECSRRAMIPDQPFEAAQGLRKAAANASRTFVELLAALDRRRGKGAQQVVRVEHVHIHPGGQAIVGNVKAGGTAAAAAKPAPPPAIGREQPGMTLDDLVGKRSELVGREGV